MKDLGIHPSSQMGPLQVRAQPSSTDRTRPTSTRFSSALTHRASQHPRAQGGSRPKGGDGCSHLLSCTSSHGRKAAPDWPGAADKVLVQTPSPSEPLGPR